MNSKVFRTQKSPIKTESGKDKPSVGNEKEEKEKKEKAEKELMDEDDNLIFEYFKDEVNQIYIKKNNLKYVIMSINY